MIHPTRRSFIGSMIALVAAPAIVRVSSIMPVKAMEPDLDRLMQILNCINLNTFATEARQLFSVETQMWRMLGPDGTVVMKTVEELFGGAP